MPTKDQTPVKPVHRTRLMMWLALLAIVVTVVISIVLDGGVRPAMLLLSAVLLAFAVVRAVSPAPGPYGIAIRSRAFDITLFVAGALVIAALTLAIPTTALG
ncbi:DUF3017 domain-containing protein [Pseudactinotalea suaedae]|uniref:DUF3017 domain-containing protein n=1 Tax=Pseudactinotalea suaedae TaxID=1524924 RepID=UPI0012E0E711|nr:DUF3017 domain-containing protein [Pseudactinotalea suaedae]